MSGLATRPLTVVPPIMLDACQRSGGVIVARWSRCGRYVTFQAATLDEPLRVDVATGRAWLVADAEDVAELRARFGDAAAGQAIRSAGLETVTRAIRSV